MPNKLQILDPSFNFKFDKEEAPVKVNLHDDMSASIGGNSAKWFSFYDQAFKVEGDDGTRYLANYRYSLKDYESTVAGGMKSLSQLDTDDYQKFDSQCGSTMVGFV